MGGLTVEGVLVAIPGLLLALVLHEFAHALVSSYLGDPTPRLQGRLSLDPLRHIDWVGLLAMFVFRFGWAKPVQIDPRYYKNPRLGLVLVALAGPAMNVVLALVALWISLHTSLGIGNVSQVIGAVLDNVVLYNVFFAVFNILPIPPLDGSRVLSAVSREGARLMMVIEPYGWIVLLLLLFTGVLTGTVLRPMADGLVTALTAVARL